MQGLAANLYRYRYFVISCFFFLSGFCSLIYQTVWLRLAFAQFGVITPVISVVISVFMAGLAIGSFIGGKYISALCRRFGLPALAFYGLSELIIGLGAFTVPESYRILAGLLLNTGEADSFLYLLLSAVAIALSILPSTLAMGATVPFAMDFLKTASPVESRNFGILYLSNVAGAVFGIIFALIDIELLGFTRTLQVSALINFSIFALSVLWAFGARAAPVPSSQVAESDRSEPAAQPAQSKLFVLVLFTTGLSSMAMELAWTRMFTPVLGTIVYSFATLLMVYLMNTAFGSLMYRLHARRSAVISRQALIMAAALTAVLPVILNDPRSPIGNLVSTALLSISPFCAVLGYLTPLIIDDLSGGDAARAGKLYAYNVLGGIIGPLVAGYFLLPAVGIAPCILILSLPLFVLAVLANLPLNSPQRVTATIAGIILLAAGFFCISWEEAGFLQHERYVIHRDYAATTVSWGSGLKKMLVVNGNPVTGLGNPTKHMSDMSLALCKQKPTSALVICFGMGTTFRTALNWDIDTTAIELVPGVKKAFAYYYDDAEKVLSNPRGRVIVDDGRRFLLRTDKKFDVIIIDPPPPAEAAGSSLLYSTEFYSLAKAHLKPGGILHQFCPDWCEKKILNAVAGSIHKSFPYVRVFRSYPAGIGFHFFCSSEPLPALTADEITAKLPPAAQTDLLEWIEPGKRNVREEIAGFLSGELNFADLLAGGDNVYISDDRPYNEYFWLRRMPGCQKLNPYTDYRADSRQQK